MTSAKSEMVRQKAAESLMTNLAQPVTAKLEVDVSYNNDVVEDLRATTRALAQQQLKMIMNGQASAGEIARSEILAKRTSDQSEPIDV
jgi:hypothetical protein